MLVFVFVFLIGICINAVHSEKTTKPEWTCDELDKKSIDEIATRVLFHQKDDKPFPGDKEELIPYCKEQSNMISKMDSYKEQCLKGKPKQIISVATYSMRAWNNLYCRNPESKHSKRLFESAGCANEASGGYRQCSNDYVDRLAQVHSNSLNYTNTVANMCCGYVKIFDCMKEVAAPLKSCTEQHTEWHEKYIRVLFDNVINVICGEYNEESGKCDKILRKRKGTKSLQQPTSSDVLKPFFNLIIDILTKQKNVN